MSRKTALLLSFVAMGAAAMADGLLLVLPANVSLINLGFDLMRMKPAGQVDMVCYGGTDEVLSLECFDRTSNRWLGATQSSWNDGTIPGARQDTLVIVGDSRAAADLLDAATWADNILTPDGHSFHEIVNAVHSVSPLTKKQWKALEKSYGISLREISVPSRYERGPQSRYSAAAPAQSLEQPPLDLAPTEVIVSAPVCSDAAEAEARLEAERKAAEEAAAKAEAEAATKLDAEKKAAEEAAAKAAAEAAAKAEAERKAAEEAAAKAAAEAAAKLEAERKAAEEAAAKAAAEAAAKAEAERKAAEEAAAKAAAEAAAKAEAEKRTVQEALEKAKAEVGAVRINGDGTISPPPVDLAPATVISTPAVAVPEAPSTGVRVPELPVVPAPLSIE